MRHICLKLCLCPLWLSLQYPWSLLCWTWSTCGTILGRAKLCWGYIQFVYGRIYFWICLYVYLVDMEILETYLIMYHMFKWNHMKDNFLEYLYWWGTNFKGWLFQTATRPVLCCGIIYPNFINQKMIYYSGRNAKPCLWKWYYKVTIILDKQSKSKEKNLIVSYCLVVVVINSYIFQDFVIWCLRDF